MTINIADNSPRISYTVAQGATQTSFAVPFEFFDNTDLNVYIDGTLKTITTHYSVSGGDGSTGTVSMSVTGGTGGSTVVITRDIELERTTDFPVSGAFNIVALNTELDRLIAVAADLDDLAGRGVKLSDFDTAATLTLPLAADRVNKVLAFNSAGDTLISQELGVWKGDWAASTAYVERDLVRDTSDGSIYIVTSAHTSSGSAPLDTNTNSSKYSVIFDVGAMLVNTISMSGNLTVNGNTTLGNASSDTITTTGTVSNLRMSSTNVTDILDEDNMSSNSAASLATQQSIKAYVDSQVGASDTFTEILGNGNTTSGTNIQLTTTDEVQFRDTALKISSSADGQLDIDADTEVEITAPTVDINASTEVNISGDLTVDTNTLHVDSSNNRVGIKTTSPDNELTVIGTGFFGASTAGVGLSNSGADLAVISGQTPSGTYKPLKITSNGPTNDYVYFDTTSGIGISNETPSSFNSKLVIGGTSGSNTMTIASGTTGVGNIHFADGTSGDALDAGYIRYHHQYDRLVLGTASATVEPLRITSSGSVGIKVSGDPSTELEVNGTITATSLVGPLATAAQPNITSLGTLTTLTVDDITINGSTISDGGTLTIDVAGEINLDADTGGAVRLMDASVNYGTFYSSSSDFVILSQAQDKDIILQGNDGGVSINALTLDMSDAGTAIFNHDIKLGDNNKAIFGASTNLEIYASGGYSYIDEVGANNLNIRTNGANIGIYDTANSQYMAKFTTGGDAELYHNGSEKLATTSTGVDVTGNVTADGVVFDYNTGLFSTDKSLSSYSSTNGVYLNGNSAGWLRLAGDGSQRSSMEITGDTHSGGEYARISVAGSERLRITSDGSVGIGTSSPQYQKFVINTPDENHMRLENGSELAIIRLMDTGILDFWSHGTSNNEITFTQGVGSGSEVMRIDSSGNVGIGVTPADSNSFGIALDVGSATGAALYLRDVDGSKVGMVGQFNEQLSINSKQSDGNIGFYTGASNTERMRITSDGSVGIGDSAPISTLEISKSDQTNGTTLTITNAFSGGSWAVDDVIGSIDFRSDDASSSELTRGRIQSVTDNVTGTNWSYGTALTFSTAFNNTLSERLRINSNGDVGIGTTAPTSYSTFRYLDIVGGTTTTGGVLQLRTSDVSINLHMYTSSAGGTVGTSTNHNLYFTTNNSTRMVIDSSGNVLVGKTTTGLVNDGAMGFIGGVGTYSGVLTINHSTTNVDGSGFINFGRDSAYIGSISQNGTTGVAYNTSSDYRLKENVDYTWDATTRLKQLKPARFNFIADADTTVDGFLAHEAQAVVPEAVTGTKDEVDADGNAVMQGIDQAKLVPLLVKTIQELEARITALEGV